MHPSSHEFLTITVGSPSPFPALPADQLTVMMSLTQSNPVVIVSLPEVTDEDIARIKAPAQGVALRRSAKMPAGALLLVLKSNEEEVWPICVPFLDDAALMRSWALTQADSNILLLILVDADTQIVRAQRTIGLPPRLLEMVRQGMLQTAVIDERAAIEELAGLNDRDIWAQSTCWQDKGDEVFTMVAEAPVFP
ncbi:MAG: hypothetical protein K2X55_21535 [Burkholderiaceae bacterium]|nr:hypothetical protein [Burkholderiaceae bacterium]